jgi:hypothetical protein
MAIYSASLYGYQCIKINFNQGFDGFLNFVSAINPKKSSAIPPPQSNQIPGCCDQAQKHKP